MAEVESLKAAATELYKNALGEGDIDTATKK